DPRLDLTRLREVPRDGGPNLRLECGLELGVLCDRHRRIDQVERALVRRDLLRHVHLIEARSARGGAERIGLDALHTRQRAVGHEDLVVLAVRSRTARCGAAAVEARKTCALRGAVRTPAPGAPG